MDLYLPRDRNYPAGIYASEIQVWANGKVFSRIPVQIEIVDVYLPDENRSNVWVYNSGMEELGIYFPGLNSQDIRRLIKFEAHRHRLDWLVDFRVNGWIKYLYSINTWFVWHSTHWTHNSQGPKGRLHQRIFNEPLTFINEHLEWGNGDGVFFYPGRMPHQVEENRGLNRFMPSIRLKNMRRGQQDFELLWLAEQKAGSDKIKALAREVVVKAMDEIDMDDKVYWPQHRDVYDAMRDRLLDIIDE